MRPVRRLRGVRVSNVYLLDGGPGDRFLVDTGHWTERHALALGSAPPACGPPS
ncbi:MAG: hypothetical protein HYV09_08095 [Deltaproteobacteria bacterium]|nr:hypothetical protein [Deltaproteobacteria bacterium]